MKTAMLSALVVLAFASVLRADDDSADTFEMFCGLGSDARESLLKCLSQKSPEEQEAMELSDKDAAAIGEELCDLGGFPGSLLSLVEAVKPQIQECIAMA
uniref:Putative secreted protein n=1 Tax=Amblyomma americanum TaxID=6943 RepID=A0A0C9SEL0_AMBAM